MENYIYKVNRQEFESVNAIITGKEILEKATKKLIEKLPTFKPGKHNGKATNVSHAFPVTFRLHE